MKNIKDFLSSLNIVLIAIIAVTVVAVLVPLSAIVLDICIGLNFVFVLMLLLLVLLYKKSYEISMLPTIQLLLTFFNLAICLSITRQILSKGADFDGRLIGFVSSFFANNSAVTSLLTIGFCTFILFYAFYFIFVVKTCTGVAEAAARFVLDSMEVKLLAVETELNTESITEEEAAVKRADIQREADFYGSLDGACKFLSGNEKVKLLILTVIFIGGYLIDILHKGVVPVDSIKTYMSFVIGAGVFFTLPTFLQAVSVMVIVSKAIKKSSEISPIIQPDTISLELGYGLVPFVEKEKLSETIMQVRRLIIRELGFSIPKVRIVDNSILEPNEYCIKINGVDSGRGKIRRGQEKLVETENYCYKVFDPPFVIIIANHLTTVIRQHAADILSLQNIRMIFIKVLCKEHSPLIDEVFKKDSGLSEADIYKILQGLLRERISISNMETILTTVAKHMADSKDIDFLIEKVRQALE
jgi:flagellar biosynthesis protein FlhA